MKEEQCSEPCHRFDFSFHLAFPPGFIFFVLADEMLTFLVFSCIFRNKYTSNDQGWNGWFEKLHQFRDQGWSWGDMLIFWVIWWGFGWYDEVLDDMMIFWVIWCCMKLIWWDGRGLKITSSPPLKNPLLQTFRSVPIKITSEPGRLPNFNKKKKWRLFCINFSPNLSSASFRAHCAASAGFPDTLSISERPILQLPVIQYCNIATSNLSHFRLLYFPTWNGFIPFSQFNFLHPPLGKALQPIL